MTVLGRSEQLRSFYEVDYIRLHPDLDAADAALKEKLLHDHLVALAKPQRLLEVGVGSGVLLKSIQCLVDAKRAIGCDISMAILKHGQSLNADRICADATNLPFRREAFDIVYFADLIEHVLDPQAALREIAVVGSYLVAYIPLEAGLLSNLVYRYQRWRGKPTNYEIYGHLYRFNRRTALRLLRSAKIGSIERWSVHYLPSCLISRNMVSRIYNGLLRSISHSWPWLGERLFGNAVLVATLKVDGRAQT